jgi:hypothetical protein
MASQRRATQEPTAARRRSNAPSSHARLKASLALRDALAAELGLPLGPTQTTLATIEAHQGAKDALEEGRYRDVLLSSLHAADHDRISALNEVVAAACARAGFAPRSSQYLALLLFARWLDLRDEPGDAVLTRLNNRLGARPNEAETVGWFTDDDLQTAAFWMATAAGKTHVLHACLAMLEFHRRWDRILLITPSEGLTRQHAAKLRRAGDRPVFAYPMDGDARALGQTYPSTVIVIDINKVSQTASGDGVTIPASSFENGRNLVFVDEGHKGSAATDQTWKRLQDHLAGIGAKSDDRRGLLVEFSATFGQVAQTDQIRQRYGKAIIYDYAYDRFHADSYGKDFQHFQVQGDQDDTHTRHLVLTAALIAYWHQLASYHTGDVRRLAADRRLEVAEPLWMLLGLSVIGKSSNKGEKEQTSDVISVLRFLAEIVMAPERLTRLVSEVLALAGNQRMVPTDVYRATTATTPDALTLTILTAVFGWLTGDRMVFRLIRAADGEMGLGLLRGDRVHYVGVVHVGDISGLKAAMGETGLTVDDDALEGSLFGRLDRPGSGLNILIGSRRFAEGWDNYRASSLTLLGLGQGEGALIVQMFGRVVRFAGCDGDGKRLKDPPAALAPLQTAYIYGLRSSYLTAFLNSLYANGVPRKEPVTCNTTVTVDRPSPLLAVIATVPERAVFDVDVTGANWIGQINRITLRQAATLTTARAIGKELQVAITQTEVSITNRFRACLSLIDRNAIYHEMIEWRRRNGWWNFRFDHDSINVALGSGAYEIYGLTDSLPIVDEEDLRRLQRLATTIVRRMFEGAYRKQESAGATYDLTGVEQSDIPPTYHKEFCDAG